MRNKDLNYVNNSNLVNEIVDISNYYNGHRLTRQFNTTDRVNCVHLYFVHP